MNTQGQKILLIVLIVMSCIIGISSATFAADETITYTYDQNLQLTRAQYGSVPVGWSDRRVSDFTLVPCGT